MTPALLLKEKQMKRKTVRKEIIEEFDANGQLKSRTTIEETEEEYDTCKNAAKETSDYDAPIPDNDQISITEYLNDTRTEYIALGR